MLQHSLEMLEQTCGIQSLQNLGNLCFVFEGGAVAVVCRNAPAGAAERNVEHQTTLRRFREGELRAEDSVETQRARYGRFSHSGNPQLMF